MATVGDPLADVGWVELLYINPASFTSQPSALTADEFVRRYEEITGIEARHREWYRAFQGFKMAVILLVGGMLFDAGHSDDLRLSEMVFAVPFLTAMALDELGIKEKLNDGPIYPRQERIADVKAAVS